MLTNPVFANEIDSNGGWSKEILSLTDGQRDELDDLYKFALNVNSVELEEKAWTDVINKYSNVPEIAVRSFANRGNSRARQGKNLEAVSTEKRERERE